MLEDTLKEIGELGYKVMWTYDEAIDMIHIRVRKGQKAYMRSIRANGDRQANEFTLDVAIRTLVERMEKENEDHRTELESGA